MEEIGKKEEVRQVLGSMATKKKEAPPQPLREMGRPRPKAGWERGIVNVLVKQFPDLPRKLEMADMEIDPRDFVVRTALNAVVMMIMLTIVLGMLASVFSLPFIVVALMSPLLFFVFFMMGMGAIDVRISQKAKEVDRESLFAGRDILIALKSGAPLFNALMGVRKEYGATSREFKKIVERIDSGIPAEIALQQAYETNKATSFRRIILQILMSLRSGADVATGLETALNQISAEQVIEIKRYGQKLNPIAMFYMLFAIIMPSLGVAIGVILSSFISLDIDFGTLVIILIGLALIQYVFLTIIRSSRPSFDI
ncbi:MAG: type II secretion system F family protein [Candidatus Micrarchaeota archaeon]|nr:type II secretion system F family protein [Candidatus Micrarchaeota archaeon]